MLRSKPDGVDGSRSLLRLDLINAIVLATLYDPRARPSATRLWISGILCAGAAGHALHQFVVLLRRR